MLHWQFTTSVLLYILSGAVTSVTAWMAWQQREQRGVVALTYAMFATALWSFTGALEIAVVEPAAKFFFVTGEYALSVIIVLLICFFVLEYHHLGGWLTPDRRRLLWASGGLMVGLTATNAWHKLIWSGFIAGPPGSNQLIYLRGRNRWTVSDVRSFAGCAGDDRLSAAASVPKPLKNANELWMRPGPAGSIERSTDGGRTWIRQVSFGPEILCMSCAR